MTGGVRHRRLGAVVALLGVGLIGSATSAAPRVGPVLIGALTEAWGPTPEVVGLRDGLIDLGYRENEHFVIGVRFTQGVTRLAELRTAAQQLVAQGAHVIVTGGGANAPKAAQMATRDVPIVFMGGSDPVGTGLVESFARPRGNVTGVADLDVELAPKRLQIFRELVPGLKRVLFPYDAGEPHVAAELQRNREAAQRLGVTLVAVPVTTQEEAQHALAGVRKGEIDGIFSPRSVSLSIPGIILEAAARQEMPAMFHHAIWVEQGGLASYSASAYHVGRAAARLVDRIVKGEKPGDIPVEQASHFDLAINLKTAKRLGLAVPPALLLRANRLVE